MTPAADALAVARSVTDVLDALGALHTIGGSIASSVAGEPRSTIDIDIVVALDELHIQPFVTALTDEFYVDADAIRRAVQTRSSVNLIHHATGIKVDIFVAGGTPIDAEQLARRQRVQVGDYTLHVHPPEDILLQKLRWFHLGGDVSDRQWRDITAIVRTQGTGLDRPYLARQAAALGVAHLLARALAEG